MITKHLDIDAVLRNLRVYAKEQVVVVVKNRAYGLGIGSLVPALVEHGYTLFGAATAKEADAIRMCGGKAHMLNVWVDALHASSLAGNMHALRDGDQLMVSTGTIRGGVNVEDVIANRDMLERKGIILHLHDGGERAHIALAELLVSTALTVSVGGSRIACKAINHPRVLYRMGDKAYGLMAGTRQAVTYATTIKAVTTATETIKVGYDGDELLKGETAITLDCGFADGYPRCLSHSRRGVLYKDVHCAILGDVTMNSMTVIVPHGLYPQVGDKVILTSDDLTLEHLTFGGRERASSVQLSLGNHAEQEPTDD